MKERVCKNCGGRAYKVVGQNMVKCMFCGTLFVDDQRSKEEEVLVVQANEILRSFKFSEAEKQFNQILSLYPMSYESFFGRMLAKNKIVLYSNKKGSVQRPRFFGEVKKISEDEDFKKALELAPPEVDKTYKDFSKRVDRIVNAYSNINEQKDVFVLSTKNENNHDKVKQLVEVLKEQDCKTFVYAGQKEEQVAKALQTAKVFLFVINSSNNFLNGDVKNIYDRYLYFIQERQKTKKSFMLILDGIDEKNLPEEIVINKRIFDVSSISFLEDILIKIKTEIKSSDKQTAKIETIDIKNEAPSKVNYVDIDSIEPTELGNYNVENLRLSQRNKIKWIYLTLKHGDFDSAKELIDQELEQDPNNAEILFAQLLQSKQLKTEEEFFSNISNFDNKETIDKILTYADKKFADNFISKWEELLISIDSEDYYNTYILYLAKFNSSKREEFVSRAEHKALETLNDELIQKVIKCFDKNDVQRFVNFYFALAQNSDNQDFYSKILEIDEGHEQSNLMLLLQKFNSTEDKLSYQNKEEVENVLKFLSEDARNHFVNSIINIILPVAFFDLEKACSQFDFYLAYVKDKEKLAEFSRQIADIFLSMEFFKEAEKYYSIAISSVADSELYWKLIKAKSHCKNEQELVVSNIKVSQFAEWETLLTLSDDKEKEFYAEVASKINLYKGKRAPIKKDLLDKKNLTEKLAEFLNRNQKILLEAEKQGFANGISYFKNQFSAFEKHLKDVEKIESFEEYSKFVEHLNERLAAMDLNLEMSVSLTQIQSREEPMKKINNVEIKTENKRQKQLKDLKRDVFLKRFLFIFAELCPLIFIAGLLVFLIVNPKETYLYFNQTFFVLALLFSIVLAFLNLIFMAYKKKKMLNRQKLSYVFIIFFGVLNLILFCIGFYFMPSPIEVANASELKTLLNNAPHAEYVLADDIDMQQEEWRAINFSGKLDGKGFVIKNVVLKNGGLFNSNNGEISNLNISLASNTYYTNKFGGVALKNSGTIENCYIFGEISIVCDDDSIIGGIVAENNGGTIKNCYSDLKLNLNIKNSSSGGIVGKSKGQSEISGNVAKFKLVANSDLSTANIGGLIGEIERANKTNVEKNQADVDIEIIGSAKEVFVGGLIGNASQASSNNYATGKISTSLTEGITAGGLYGKYQNTNLNESITTSYSTVEIDGEISKGSLIGSLGGVVDSCFATGDYEFYAIELFSIANTKNCLKEYSSVLNFDENIWNLSQELPVLKQNKK